MNDYMPIVVDRKSSQEERQIALRQIYQQVLERQPYEYERTAIAKLEKTFSKGSWECVILLVNLLYLKSISTVFMKIVLTTSLWS